VFETVGGQRQQKKKMGNRKLTIHEGEKNGTNASKAEGNIVKKKNDHKEGGESLTQVKEVREGVLNGWWGPKRGGKECG